MSDLATGKPRPPDELVGALQDRVETPFLGARAARTVRVTAALLLACSSPAPEPLPDPPNGNDLSAPSLVPSGSAPEPSPPPPAPRRYVRRPFRKQPQ